MSKKLFTNSPLSPCKDCQDRLTGDKDCHKNCEKYTKWKIHMALVRKKEIQQKREELFQDFLRSQRTPKKYYGKSKRR